MAAETPLFCKIKSHFFSRESGGFEESGNEFNSFIFQSEKIVRWKSKYSIDNVNLN